MQLNRVLGFIDEVVPKSHTLPPELRQHAARLELALEQRGPALQQSKEAAQAAEPDAPDVQGPMAEARQVFEQARELPHGWGEKQSRSTGETYYVNLTTGESTFERPSASPHPVKPRSTLAERRQLLRKLKARSGEVPREVPPDLRSQSSDVADTSPSALHRASWRRGGGKRRKSKKSKTRRRRR